MSVYEVTCYAIKCDEPGCETTTAEVNHEYSGWDSEESAILDWTGGGGVGSWDDNQVTAEGKHYCSEHIKPECGYACGRTEGLLNDEPPDNGDWYCSEHAPKEPTS
jgi:hypothetical protein